MEKFFFQFIFKIFIKWCKKPNKLFFISRICMQMSFNSKITWKFFQLKCFIFSIIWNVEKISEVRKENDGKKTQRKEMAVWKVAKKKGKEPNQEGKIIHFNRIFVGLSLAYFSFLLFPPTPIPSPGEAWCLYLF